MLPWKTKRPREFDAGADTLSRLLDRELLLTSQLEAAKAEAERLLREAREYATGMEAACETTIKERTAALAASYEQQLQAELSRIESEAAAEAGRFAEPDTLRVKALVALLLDAIGATGVKPEAAG